MNTKFTIRGVELEFDAFDADQAERLEEETKKVMEAAKAAPAADGLAAAIRVQCGVLSAFFDRLFGEGTSVRLFGGKASLPDCLEAFGAVMAAISAQRAELNALLAKYHPAPA